MRTKSGRRRAARPGKSDRAEAQTRVQISVEAARIMAEEGVHNFHSAKRKAAARLNLAETRDLPSNQEIASALRQHLQLFHADLPQTLQRLRRLALEAMRFLAQFEPRLVGPVLTGTVTAFLMKKPINACVSAAIVSLLCRCFASSPMKPQWNFAYLPLKTCASL